MATESRGRGFDRLLEYVEEAMEFATSSYNDAYLDRRITARMRRNDLEEYGRYRRLLERDADERAALLEALSVNVTSFFRNPEVWPELRGVLRELTDAGRTRVWSAACSDGREAYSLAMLVRDDAIDPARVDILGTDIEADIVAAAREGRYEASETEDLEEQLDVLNGYDRYIEREGDDYQVRDRVKRLVEFRQHDLIREAPPDTFDLVLCRNLFIYVDADAKRAVFETLTSGLAEGGYLTIGMTETVPPGCRSAFTPVAKRHRVYRATGD